MLTFLACASVLLGPAHGDDSVTRIVFRSQNPGLASNPAAAEPRTLYRMGTTRGRVEQPLDASAGGTSLFIANGKDGWIINLADHTGRHLIDPSTDHSFYAPLVPAPGPNKPAPVHAFEMGRELAFMQGQAVVPQAVSKDGLKFSLYQCNRQGYTLQLYLNAETFLPAEVDVLKDGRLLTRVFYLKYETLPADPALFAPPKDVKLTQG